MCMERINISIDEEHRRFLKENNLSPSTLLRDKINEILQIKDPELYQINLDRFNKNVNKQGITKWQKAYWNCETYKQKRELEREFLKAIMGDAYEENIQERSS